MPRQWWAHWPEENLREVWEPPQGARCPNPAAHLQLSREVGCPGPAVVVESQIQVQAVVRVQSKVQLAEGMQQEPTLIQGVLPDTERAWDKTRQWSGVQTHSLLIPPCPGPGHQDWHGSLSGLPPATPIASPPLGAGMTFKKLESGIIPHAQSLRPSHRT